jgi:uncharacterized phage-associated protein
MVAIRICLALPGSRRSNVTYDPREVANFVLDVADQIGCKTTNLALNKIVYFLHGIYLARTNKALIEAKIEAWEYGPVFREIYHSFKGFGDGPILKKASFRDYASGMVCEYSSKLNADEREMLEPLAESYLRIRAGKLVDMSHVEDGPWHAAWYHEGRVNPGMEITNDAIRVHFAKSVRH